MANLDIRNCPWHDKGRWYRFFIEADGTKYYLTESPLEGAAIEGTKLVLPSGYHLMQVVPDIHSINEGSVSNCFVISFLADDRQAIMLPNKNTFSHGYVWVYAYKDGEA